MKGIASILKFLGGCFLLLVLWATFRGYSHRDSPTIALLPALPVDDAVRANPLIASLTPTETHFSWNGWGIKVNQLQFADSIETRWRDKTADREAVFVVLDLTVQNNKDKGVSFIPQNMLKVVVGGKEIDCADLENKEESFVDNLEPTLSSHRKGYFEVPKALLTNPFVIRFSQVWEDSHDLTVHVASRSSVQKNFANKEEFAPATSVALPASVTEKAAAIPVTEEPPSVTEEQRAAWKRFADEDKKERELLKKQEAKRRAAYEAAKREQDSIVGAKPAPQ
jgi:hypothetical protein